MKEQEKKFYDFILERTQEKHKEDMEHLVAEFMERRQTDQLNKMYLMGTMPRFLSYLNPDSIDEVKKIMSDFSSKL